MIYKFRVDQHIECWVSKEYSIEADNQDEAIIKAMREKNINLGSIIPNTVEYKPDIYNTQLEIYDDRHNAPLYSI